jgi:hypothetical protein
MIGFSLIAMPLAVSSLAKALPVHCSFASASASMDWSLLSSDSKIVLTLQDDFLTCGVSPSSIGFPFSFF